VTDDLDDLGLSPAADLAVQTVAEIETTTDKLPSPAFVANAVGPEVLLVERREVGNGVAYEAAGCMCVHAEQERDKEVVSVPESLKRLLSDPMVGGGVDQEHAKQHDVAGDTTSLGVMDLESNLRSYLNALNVEEATVY
jgi:hypothetical protein